MKPTAKSLNIKAYLGQQFRFDSSFELDDKGNLEFRVFLYNEEVLITHAVKLETPDVLQKAMALGNELEGKQIIHGGALLVTLDAELLKQFGDAAMKVTPLL